MQHDVRDHLTIIMFDDICKTLQIALQNAVDYTENQDKKPCE